MLAKHGPKDLIEDKKMRLKFGIADCGGAFWI